MPEETSLGVARARESDEDYDESDLQHRMEEARESIKESVSELKNTVADHYNSVKESVTEELDWREQVRKRPVAWSLGALGVGIVVGYSLAGLIEGDDERRDDAASKRMRSAPVQIEGGGPSAFTDHHSYAAHARATASGAYGSSGLSSPAPGEGKIDESLASRPSYSSGYEQTPTDIEKAGLIDRFKETRAYDRLQDEVSDLGNRFMDELANAARFIVLPALFNKLKEMIGIDLSNKRQAGNAAVQQPKPQGVPQGGKEQPPGPSQSRPPGDSTTVGIRSSERGKPTYPRTKESLSKFDRLASDTPTPSGQADQSPHINLNYDDRYERESKLFTRGENRGFAAGTPGEPKTPATDVRSTDRDDAPHGKDYTYQSGRTNDS